MSRKELKITKLTKQIRELFNDSIIKKTTVFSKKNDGDWDQLHTALDTIGDTCQAIESFLNESDEVFMKQAYLNTYGLLQALYMQQDAINFLKRSLFGHSKSIDFKNPKYGKLAEIRLVRAETIGHPVCHEIKPKKSKFHEDEITSCTIDRSSLSKKGFRYMLWMSSKTKSKSINFNETIEQQDKHLSAILEAIVKELIKEEGKHRAKFKGKKLANLLNPSLYSVRLIYGVNWDDHLAWPSFKHYYKVYKEIRKDLESRYGEFEKTLGIPGTKEVIKKLDYIFAKLDEFRKTNKFEKYELEVFVDALLTELDELKKHLEEIDKEFDN